MLAALKTLVGTSIALGVCAIDAFGINLQRLDHLHQQTLAFHLRQPEYKRPRWLLGMGLHIAVQVVGTPVSLIFLQPAVSASLGASSLIFNILFARFLVGTRINLHDVIGTLILITGGTLVAVFGDLESGKFSLEELIRLYRRPVFIIYFSILEALSLSLFFIAYQLAKRLDRRLRRHSTPTVVSPISVQTAHVPSSTTPLDTSHTFLSPTENDSLLPHASPVKYFFGQTTSTAGPEATSIRLLRRLCGAAYAACGAMMASQTLILADTVVRLLKESISNGNNQFVTVEPFVLAVILILLAIIQV